MEGSTACTFACILHCLRSNKSTDETYVVSPFSRVLGTKLLFAETGFFFFFFVCLSEVRCRYYRVTLLGAVVRQMNLTFQVTDLVSVFCDVDPFRNILGFVVRCR